ncbi:hypothetical protein AB3R30_24960 [Leptolyngbyaceae cyanobacterium UHCC 1019]
MPRLPICEKFKSDDRTSRLSDRSVLIESRDVRILPTVPIRQIIPIDEMAFARKTKVYFKKN